MTLFQDLMQKILLRATDFQKNSVKFRQSGDAIGTMVLSLLSYNLYSILLETEKEQPDVEIAESEKIKQAQIELGGIVNALQDQITDQWNTKTNNSNQSNNDDIDCSIVKMVELNEKNCITFDDVIGLENVKNEFYTGFIYPIRYQQLYPRKTRGILLYGLPGTGKTFIVRAAIDELSSDQVHVLFYAPSGAELKGKYVGETEKRIASYFHCAAKDAEQCQKKTGIETISVLFIDEIEAIGATRLSDTSGIMTNSVNMLLQKMDGIQATKNVVVIAATNFPWKLDSALKRRFDLEIHIDLPTGADIYTLILQQLGKYLDISESVDADHADAKNDDPDDAEKQQEKLLKEIDDNVAKDPCIQRKCARKTIKQQQNQILAITQLSSAFIRDIADELYAKYYSNSDVVRYMRKLISICANMAKAHGVFELVSDDSNDAIFLSTLSQNNVIIFV